jgi:hypothetical protein
MTADAIFSEGVVGQRRTLLAAALAQDHEGVMPEQLGSLYRPR